MPNYFIRVDNNFVTRGDLLARLENQDWPEEFTIQGIVNANNPVSLSHIFHRIEDGYSFSTHQVLFYPGLGAAGANQGVDFEHVRQEVIDIMNGFGPNAEVILNPPAAQQANVNIAADWDDLPDPEPVAPGPGFVDPELGHLPPLMAQQALGAPEHAPGALPMPAFLPGLPMAQPAAVAQPAAQQNQNNNNMSVYSNNNNYMNMNNGGGRRKLLRRKSQRRSSLRGRSLRGRTQRRKTQRRRTQRR